MYCKNCRIIVALAGQNRDTCPKCGTELVGENVKFTKKQVQGGIMPKKKVRVLEEALYKKALDKLADYANLLKSQGELDKFEDIRWLVVQLHAESKEQEVK